MALPARLWPGILLARRAWPPMVGQPCRRTALPYTPWPARHWHASERRCATLFSAAASQRDGSHCVAAGLARASSTLTTDAHDPAQLSDEPQAPPSHPVVLVLSGPSGVGKDAVVRQLQARRPETRFVVTATTRPMRPGERHGVDYLFVSRPEFDSLIARDELLEHALVYGEYKGIPKSQVRDALAEGHDVVLRLDVQGAATMRRLLPCAVFVFLVAESEAALAQRLMSRKTEPPDKLRLRVATARDETRRMDEFDYVVVNAQGRLDAAVDALCSIIDAERCKVHRQQPPQL